MILPRDRLILHFLIGIGDQELGIGDWGLGAVARNSRKRAISYEMKFPHYAL
jgi:hypothetical protein